jgi:hypothetical protein
MGSKSSKQSPQIVVNMIDEKNTKIPNIQFSVLHDGQYLSVNGYVQSIRMYKYKKYHTPSTVLYNTCLNVTVYYYGTHV